MIKRLTTAACSLATLVALFAACVASAAPAAPGFDYDPDIHAQLDLDVTGQGLVSGTPGENATPSCRDDQSGPGCSITYLKNAIVNLHADPDPGWLFAGWTGCLNQTGAYCQVVMAEDPHTTYDGVDVTATFTKFAPSPTQQPLTVTVNGPGHVSGPDIGCPNDCYQAYITGASVTLQAQPQPLATFMGWGGACNGGPLAACVVTMDAARQVTATFAADIPIGTPRTLTVAVTGSGTGSVTSGSAIDCPGDCAQSYTIETNMTLTAAPALGSVFEGWSGACGGSALTCQVTMSASRAVTATFEKAPDSPGNPGDPGGPGNPGQGGPSQPGPDVPGFEDTCTLTGTPGDDVLVGTPGRDVICGRAGNDRLLGKRGNDVLVGGPGADVLIGGRGKDLLLGAGGKDRLLGGPGGDQLQGGRGNDRLVGGGNADRLLGNGGSDLLLARDRLKDRLDGGAGRDRARIDRKDVSKRIESTF